MVLRPILVICWTSSGMGTFQLPSLFTLARSSGSIESSWKAQAELRPPKPPPCFESRIFLSSGAPAFVAMLTLSPKVLQRSRHSTHPYPYCLQIWIPPAPPDESTKASHSSLWPFSRTTLRTTSPLACCDLPSSTSTALLAKISSTPMSCRYFLMWVSAFMQWKMACVWICCFRSSTAFQFMSVRGCVRTGGFSMMSRMYPPPIALSSSLPACLPSL